jgi:hypothetical protein
VAVILPNDRNVRMMRYAKLVVLGCLLLGSSVHVVAQTAAGPPRDPKSCEPGALPPQQPTKPPGTSDPGATTGSGESPSDGVLCPPEVDRDMHIRPRDGGKTPVIPPPGSPGGDPNVRPK